MLQYLNLIHKILNNGYLSVGRNNNQTFSLFGETLKFNLKNNILPVITTKEIHLKSVIYELLWMIKGSTNTKFLNDNGVTIWDEWANNEGDLGPIYGKQWRNIIDYKTRIKKDQLQQTINNIQNNPFSRRHVISAWNVSELNKMALAPCHILFQFNVEPNNITKLPQYLSCHLYQRSADVFLGLPFNITSYALLTHMIAKITGIEAKELIISLGNAHIYVDHLPQCWEILKRKPLKSPKVYFKRLCNNKLKYAFENINDFKYEDIVIKDYIHHPKLSGKVCV